jgi:hypothetical protein
VSRSQADGKEIENGLRDIGEMQSRYEHMAKDHKSIMRLQISSRRLQISSRRLQISSRRLQISSRRLQISSRRSEIDSKRFEPPT